MCWTTSAAFCELLLAGQVAGPSLDVEKLTWSCMVCRYRHVSREEAQHLWQQAYSAAAYGATSKDAQVPAHALHALPEHT